MVTDIPTVNPKNAISAFSGEYAFLSNFHPSLVVLDGIRFCTVEHAYQAAKTLDYQARISIGNEPTPGKAKRAGAKAVLRPEWDKIKIRIMQDLLRQKFSVPSMAERLLLTGNSFLIEGNTWGDEFWGATWTSQGWHGRNMLGLLLMQIREELRRPVTIDPVAARTLV